MDRIEQLLKPYLPQEKGQTFFRAVANIEESQRGKETREAYGDTSHKNVYSLGVLMDTEHGNHQVLYNHSHKMENGYMYNTILGRPLNELSKKELDDLHKNLSEKVETNKVYPAVIREDYDEGIGDEDHSYFAVVFNKPFDEEQEEMADHNECETINPDKSEYIFMDYDNAVRFASDNARALEYRGNLRREIGDDERPYFYVTFESNDKRLDAIAQKHNGGVDYTSLGTPLAMAGFLTVRDARAYRNEAREILSLGSNTVNNPLSKVLSGDITHEEVEKAMESNLVKHWVKAKSSNDETTMKGYDQFGPGSSFIHEFAKAQLGINNRYDPVNMFDNSWEAIEGYIDYAKEKGLDSAIADKYDFHYGSGDPERIMEHPEDIYSEQELNEISKFLKPKGFEDFKAALRSLPEAKQIATEEERIKSYQNGDALTKAFVLYDIAQRRLHNEHEGDEHFFHKQRTWSRPDGSRGILTKNQETPSGATEGYKWVIKSDVAKELMRLIATSPLTEKVPLLEQKAFAQIEESDIKLSQKIERLREDITADFKERIINPSMRSFHPDILQKVRDFTAAMPHGATEALNSIKDDVQNDPEVKRKPAQWFTDAAKEFNAIIKNEEINLNEHQGLKR